VTDRFAEIRPYDDHEVSAVINRLKSDTELLDSIINLRLGGKALWLIPLLRPIVRWGLGRQLRGVNDVASFQSLVRSYMDQMIDSTTAGFEVSGLDDLPEGPYLFVSNHRDIALDPAFTNYALHTRNRATCRIAIGDNLLSKPWIADLMRVNKSFIVKRALQGPRQLLAASKLLSEYIGFSISEDKSPVWIAQREGRAKNGLDATEPAVIKMLLLGRDKTLEFGQSLANLRIVPVSISYELDPCDAMKAHELATLARDGSYSKAEHEDARSIAVGIAGSKGKVSICFGSVLGAEFNSVDQVVNEIDRQVISHYQLHPSNIWAWQRLNPGQELPRSLSVSKGSISKAQFNARVDALSADEQPFMLAMYANSVEQAISAGA
jgi:hypothetical protein